MSASSASAAMRLRVEVHDRFNSLPLAVRERMREHARREGVQHGPSWFANLETTVFADHPGLAWFVLRRGDAVRAVLPLVGEAADGSWEVRALGNYYTCLFLPALDDDLDDAELAEVFAAVRRRFAPLAELRLTPMDPLHPAFGRLERAARRAGLAADRYYAFGNWFLRRPLAWAPYLAAREGKVRTTIQRMGKRFAAEGGRLEIIRGGERLDAGVQAYLDVYARSWKKPEPYPEFVPGLIRSCALHGWLRLGVAWLGERPVAAQLWIVDERRAEIYKLAYDDDFKKLSPGTLLSQLMMREVIDEGHVDEIDYLVGDDPYKREWMNERRERWGLLLHDLRTVAGVRSWLIHTVGQRTRSLRAMIDAKRTARAARKQAPRAELSSPDQDGSA